ncbi:hypothetical protein Zmor_009741 [Zophobas morio]|uniref:Ig-like domain-containing protein n=1 Tax=Zophobas morio TaxID=2755281 RepID=A0AA38MJ39_9CUCU|nr:hypothetical protein Zmor_009741 [Zophobas morio]
MIRMFLFLFLLNAVCAVNEIHRNCRDRDRLIENQKGDLYTLVDATHGQKLTLQCHYCDENDDGRPKVWYKVDDIGNPEPHEVILDMNNNSTENRVEVNIEHSLTVNNFSKNDTGLYYCQYYEGEESEKYNYLVDLVYNEDNVTNMETGNFSGWRKYYEVYFVPVNSLFSHSEGTEFKNVREEMKIEMEIVTQWGPWGICEVCGRPKNEGVRKKTGFCRIKMTHKVGNHFEINPYAAPARRLWAVESFLVCTPMMTDRAADR